MFEVFSYRKKYLITLAVVLICQPVYSQLYLSLKNAVDLAQKQSLYYHKARNSYEKNYWRYNNFKASFKPQIRLGATIPTFYRAINPITQPDGSILFQRVWQTDNMTGLRFSQRVGLTGGTLAVGTSLQWTKNFLPPGSNYFLTTPFTIRYSQNSILYNEAKWTKTIEPILFKTAQKAYSAEIEDAGFEGAKLFLEAMALQNKQQSAYHNIKQADTLFVIAKERFAAGTVSKSDLLQLELNLLKAKNSCNEIRMGSEIALRNLKRFLGIPPSDSLTLLIPEIPLMGIQIGYEKALSEALSNRQDIMEFRTRKLLAEQEIARAKGQNSIEFSLETNLGTQQSASTLGTAYQNLQNQQYVGVSFDIPIQDWGFRKSQIRLAKANKELVDITIQQDGLAFEQEIYLQTMQINQQFNQVVLAQKADTIASERLEITKQRYLLGKISVSELNMALEERITAQQGSVAALKEYWITYYTLRKLTLYDFIHNHALHYLED